MVKVDLTECTDFFDAPGPNYALAAEAHRTLADKSGAGSEFTGWIALPKRIRDKELKSILSAAEKIRNNSQVLIVIGIGGSYLGARAAIELLSSPERKGFPEVYFVGNGLSPDALNATLDRLENRDFSVNVISKSGTTLEPALAFRVFKSLLEQKYGAHGARKR
ncbi:MAG: glucose-6-phosphate isomerase, partial [Oscillospiraceae bacterium]